MKHIYALFIILMMGSTTCFAQDNDLILTGSETGTKIYQAKNSITFSPNYSYTATDGNSMKATIVYQVDNSTISYNSSVVDPDTRVLNTSNMVGTTNGSFAVSSSGGATYTISLDLPPGVSGLQPTLSLNYNSLAGPGIAGYGWQLGGLSAVTRSPQTYYYDGTSIGVDLTSTDRFSLDGQRLVCTSGTYGANYSEYRTELDQFTKITCFTDGTSSPKRFLAKTKTGLTIEYGYEGDSDQNIDGLTEDVNWYIDKVTDVYGNTMEYDYVKLNGQNYIGEIKYGPNSIIFYYKERTDKSVSYFLGKKLEQSLILDRIEVKYNSNIVKKYELKYNYTSSLYNSHSVLNEVVEYGTGSSRYNSTVFNYQTPDDVSFTQVKYDDSNDFISYKSDLIPGDFNGDGKTDFFCKPNKYSSWTGYKVYTSDGNDGFNFAFENTSYDFGDLVYITSIDLNADGKDDIVYENTSGDKARYYYLISNGNSFTPHLLSYSPPLVYKHFLFFSWKVEDGHHMTDADFDGDGVNDIFINTSSGKWSIFSLGGDAGLYLNDMILKGSGELSTLSDNLRVADFNGDGKDDIWSFNENGLSIYTFDGSTLVLLFSDNNDPLKNPLFELGDFNADGKTDIFIWGKIMPNQGGWRNWPYWKIFLSTGTGFERNEFPSKITNLIPDYFRVGDFNGDGASDIMTRSLFCFYEGAHFLISKNGGTDFSTYNIEYPDGGDIIQLGDFNGDGRTDILCNDGVNCSDESGPSWNGYKLYRSGNKNQILLTKIGNGLGELTQINYQSLSEFESSYVKGSGASFPVMDYQGPLQVVKSVLSDNGIGLQNTITYKFEGAKIHRRGKGFLCYTKQTVTDVANNMSTETNYVYDIGKFIPELSSLLTKSGGTVLNKVSNTWTYEYTTIPGGSAIFPYISSSTQTNNLTRQNVTTAFSYDMYGNPTKIAKVYDNGVTETTTNQYTNDIDNWYVGKLSKSTIEYKKTEETTISKTVSYTYFDDGILKPDFIKYYEGTDKYYYKNYDYDANGNTTQLFEYADDGGSKQTNYTYEDGIRVKTITDPMGHTTAMAYDNYGRLSSKKDYLNNTISYTYDEMSRQLTITQADGFVASTGYFWGLTGGPSYAAYYVQQSGNDGSQSKVWYDKLGREIRSDVRGFNGSDIFKVSLYNAKGQLYMISEPYLSTPPQWNTYLYDSYGRISGITRPSGRNTTFAYSGNRVTETTGGKISWKETDSQGLTTKAHDSGGDLIYTYYPDGKTKTITSPGGAVTSMEYDVAGNQTKLGDPSAGTVTYTYDGFGRLKTQKNARNQTTNFSYYVDGRPISKVSPEGTTSYTYNGNKQLTNITSPGSVSRSYTYDTKGRTASVSETIPGQSTFTTSFTYDSKGRLDTRTHPSGIVETNNYNSYGYLASILADGVTQYTITSKNARQQITGSKYGESLNGNFEYDSYGFPTRSRVTVNTWYDVQDFRYSFNPVTGNLDSRQNYSKIESFTYDNLDRLLTVSGPQNLTMSYSDNGNILSKSDLGPGNYTYGNSTRPFAVTGIHSGNQVIPSASQVISYTSFDKVNTIDEDIYHATFTYNSEGKRCKMLITDQSSTLLTRWYVGSRYMKETKGSTTTEYTWIGGDAYSAPVVAEKTGSTINYYYLFRDYLGNITHKVNTSNTVVAKYSFDAWGRRRNATDWSYNLSGEPDLVAGRGFTGHEHLSYFNIINMNGRLYDPLVGRFLSPDNYVQMPGFTQSHNRYSYCINNPLKYTDLNGQWFGLDDALGFLIGGTINLTVNLLQGNIDNFGEGLAAFAAGGAAGTLALYGPAGWAAGGAIVGGTNAWISGARGWDIVKGAGIGALSGLAGGAAGSWAAQGLGGLVINGLNVASPIMKGMISGAIGGAAGGYVGGFTGGLLMTGDFSAAHQAGINGMVFGAPMGAVSGSVGAYAAAKKAGINPFTGRPKNSITIGEGMTTDAEKGWMGVDKISEDLGSESFQPNDLPKENWFTDGNLMEQNAHWIELKMQNRYVIYDRGGVGNNSQYYNMEVGRTMNYPVWRVTPYYNKTQTIRLLIIKKY